MSAHSAGGARFLNKMRLYDAIMADPEFTDADRRVAWALIFGFHNTKTGECFPSIDLLAERARLKRRATFHSVKRLIGHGYFRCTPGGGRGRANDYEPALERVHGGAPFIDTETVRGGARKGARRRQKMVHGGAPQHKKEHKKEPRGRASASFASLPGGGSARFASPKVKTVPQQEGRTKCRPPSMRPRLAQQTEEHRRLWADVHKLDQSVIARIIELPKEQHDRALAAERDTPHSGVLLLLKAVETSAQAPKPGLS